MDDAGTAFSERLEDAPIANGADNTGAEKGNDQCGREPQSQRTGDEVADERAQCNVLGMGEVRELRQAVGQS